MDRSPMDLLTNLNLPSWPNLFLALLTLLTGIAFRRRYLSDLSSIPGPFWASITRLWHVWYILKGDQNERLKALHARHGHFVRIAPNEVSVCHPDGSTKLLYANLHKAPWYRVTAVPDVRYQNPMSTRDPKEKIALSKHFAPGYALSHVLKSETDIDENVADLLDWMDIYAVDQRPMELDKFITYTTSDNVGSVFFSESFGFIKAGRDIRGTLRNNVALSKFASAAGFFIPILRIFVNPLNSWIFLLPMGQLFTRTLTAIEKRMQNSDARYDMLSHWLDAHKKHPDKLSFRQIVAQANVNVGAGGEPVSTAIQSFVYHMIQHPASWQRLRDSIDEAQAKGLCLDRVISFHDAEQLPPFFEACVKEALRLFGPTTMGLPRVVPPSGITIGGRTFRPGTILSVSSHSVHASTEIWGPDAGEWKPERWMSKGSKVNREMEKNWLVFSAGFMICPGRHFARMQILKIAATLVRDYDIRQVDPTNVWKYQANFTALTHSWPVYVQRRIPSKE